MLNSAPVTPLANGQWEARVRALPVSPSAMPEVGLADSSVRRAGPARSTAFAHLKTFIPAGQPRLRRAGREETSTLSNRVSPCTFVAAWSALGFRPGAWSMPNCASPRQSLEYGAGTATTQCNTPELASIKCRSRFKLVLSSAANSGHSTATPKIHCRYTVCRRSNTGPSHPSIASATSRFRSAYSARI
jgi:hypothetical protein